MTTRTPHSPPTYGWKDAPKDSPSFPGNSLFKLSQRPSPTYMTSMSQSDQFLCEESLTQHMQPPVLQLRVVCDIYVRLGHDILRRIHRTLQISLCVVCLCVHTPEPLGRVTLLFTIHHPCTETDDLAPLTNLYEAQQLRPARYEHHMKAAFNLREEYI